MKRITFFLLGTLLAFSGAMACGESANMDNASTPVVDQAETNANTTNNPNAVPDDLSGTNLAPPPAPPSNP